MKINKTNKSNSKTKTTFDSPPIPLEPQDFPELTSGNSLTMTLKSSPNQAGSVSTYKLQIPIFKSGTPELWIHFQKQLQEIFTGQNINTGPT